MGQDLTLCFQFLLSVGILFFCLVSHMDLHICWENCYTIQACLVSILWMILKFFRRIVRFVFSIRVFAGYIKFNFKFWDSV